MSNALADASIASVRYYLTRMIHVLKLLSEAQNSDEVLATRLAPDMLDTGLNFAIAIKFSARTLCPPAGIDVPEIPDLITCDSLLDYAEQISNLIAPLKTSDIVGSVSHVAGEAEIDQDAADYVARFAQPNMIFHFSIAYAGLRHAGVNIGKADFDGLHIYR